MIHSRVVIGCLLILVFPVLVQALDTAPYDGLGIEPGLLISQTGRQKALQERGVTVTNAKDDLIRRTVRAYGGDYVRKQDYAVLTLLGKTYKNFTAKIVDGKYLLIKTPDDAFHLELVE